MELRSVIHLTKEKHLCYAEALMLYVADGIDALQDHLGTLATWILGDCDLAQAMVIAQMLL